MIIEVLADLLQPRFLSTIVTNGIEAGNMNVIYSTGIKMLIVVAIGFSGGVLSAVFASIASQRFGCSLREAAFNKVTSFSIEQTDKFSTGSLITRLTSDITAAQDFVSMGLRMVVRVCMQFVGGIVMILTLNVKFGIVFACALPLQILLIVIMVRMTAPLFSVVQDKLDNVNSVVRENVVGARVVKSFTTEEYEINRFKEANNSLTEKTYRVQKIIGILNPFIMIIMNLSVIAILSIGGYEVRVSGMEVGDAMAAVTYVTQILMSVMIIGNMFQNLTKAKACMGRIAEILEVEPAVKTGEKNFPKDFDYITLKNVSFAYPPSEEKILEDINLKIPVGKTTAILGATGSGKSTLLKLICRFYDCNGEILFGDEEIKNISLDSLRENISFVLQKSELFTGTISENIKQGKDNATDEEIENASKIAQAHEFISGFANGYETFVAEKGASLSGGQKQRISIARGLIKKPKILVFDDATSALDLSTEAALRKAMNENLEGVTVIMVAQRIASVMSADNIAVIDDGKIAAFGNHETLIKTSDIYKDIYNSQMKEGDDR
ncbi:MAG: ABC transporter ATP-binding protein [Ruminococcaceae bacterium]|nr:ABC transporter ATP-binding protein [Oscillospiraceae bacterium]